jgi:hypothetical protein
LFDSKKFLKYFSKFSAPEKEFKSVGIFFPKIISCNFMQILSFDEGLLLYFSFNNPKIPHKLTFI